MRGLSKEKTLIILLTITCFLPKETLIISIFFCASIFLFLVEFLKSSKKLKMNKVQFLIFFLFVVFLSSETIEIINGYFISLVNFLIYFVIYGYFFFLIYAFSKKGNYTLFLKAVKLFKLFAWLQVIIILIKAPVYNFKKGDWAFGTTIHAHAAGFFIIVLCTHLLYDLSFNKKILTVIKLIIAFYAMYLCDVNQFMFSWFLSIGITLFVFSNRSKKFFVGFISILLIIFTIYWFWESFSWVIDNVNNIRKFKGYCRLIKLYENNSLLLPYGVGLGMFSSRAAVALADANTLAKPEGKKLKISSTSPYLKKYLSDLYSPEYYQYLVKIGVTGTFYTPFSEVLSILSEYGILGSMVFIILWFSFLKSIYWIKNFSPKWAYITFTLIITYSIVLFYDNWLGRPGVFFPVLLHVLFCLNLLKRIRDEYKILPKKI